MKDHKTSLISCQVPPRNLLLSRLASRLMRGMPTVPSGKDRETTGQANTFLPSTYFSGLCRWFATRLRQDCFISMLPVEWRDTEAGFHHTTSEKPSKKESFNTVVPTVFCENSYKKVSTTRKKNPSILQGKAKFDLEVTKLYIVDLQVLLRYSVLEWVS